MPAVVPHTTAGVVALWTWTPPLLLLLLLLPLLLPARATGTLATTGGASNRCSATGLCGTAPGAAVASMR